MGLLVKEGSVWVTFTEVEHTRLQPGNGVLKGGQTEAMKFEFSPQPIFTCGKSPRVPCNLNGMKNFFGLSKLYLDVTNFPLAPAS